MAQEGCTRKIKTSVLIALCCLTGIVMATSCKDETIQAEFSTPAEANQENLAPAKADQEKDADQDKPLASVIIDGTDVAADYWVEIYEDGRLSVTEDDYFRDPRTATATKKLTETQLGELLTLMDEIYNGCPSSSVFILDPCSVQVCYRGEVKVFTYLIACDIEANGFVSKLVEYSPVEIRNTISVGGGPLQPADFSEFSFTLEDED